MCVRDELSVRAGERKQKIRARNGWRRAKSSPTSPRAVISLNTFPYVHINTQVEWIYNIQCAIHIFRIHSKIGAPVGRIEFSSSFHSYSISKKQEARSKRHFIIIIINPKIYLAAST